jgi:hypothetical protein
MTGGCRIKGFRLQFVKMGVIAMVKPLAVSHGMGMLFLATPSLQPLRDRLVERVVEGFC